MTCPAPVGEDSVASPLSVVCRSTSFARPKSSTFTRPSVVTNTFSGFRSRWTIPFACAASSPCATCTAKDRACRCVGARREAISRSVSPSQQLRDDVGDGRAGVGRLRSHVVDGQDVRVVEGGHGPRLALEPCEPFGVGGQLRGQHLDRDLASQPRVAGAVDLAHPAGPDEAEDLVRPETRAGSQ